MSRAAERAALRSAGGIVDRGPLIVMLAVALAAVALAYALPHLRIDTSTEEMISAEVPFRQNRIAFIEAFPQFRDPVVAVIEGAAPEQVEQAATALAAALKADDEHFAAVEYIEGEPFFATHGLLYLELDELAALSDRLAAAQPLLAALAADPSLRGLADFVALALAEGDTDDALPPALDRLLGAMADVVAAQRAGRPRVLSWREALQEDAGNGPARQLVIAQPRVDPTSLEPAAPAIEALRAEAQALGIHAAHGLELRLTGAAALDLEELESVRSGASLAALLTTLAVTLLLVWGLGSLRLIAATLITLAIGLILTAAFAALAIGRLNLISITFAVLFVGLGVDFGIHLVLRYREARDAGGEHRSALCAAIRGVGRPLSLSALCAALGFLAFVPTEYQGLAELGIISAAGMVIAWLLSLILLPALLSIMRPTQRTPPPQDRHLLAGVLDRPRAVVGLAMVLGLASVFALPRIAFDFNPLHLKDPESESVRTFRALAADRATSVDVIEVLAGNLEEADAIAARLAQESEVGQTLTLSSFVPDDQEPKLALIDELAFLIGPLLEPGAAAPPPDDAARQAAFTRLAASVNAAGADANPGATCLAEELATLEATAAAPARAELEARLVATLPDLLARLRQALDARPVTLSDLPQSLRARWVNPEGQARVVAAPVAPLTDNEALAAFARAVLAVEPRATGTPIIVTEAGDAVIGAFQRASWLALGLITLLLAVVLRRLRDILLVLAPLALAVLYTAASAAILGLSLNFANVIVLPLLLGLGVSGAIHVVMRWREEAEPGRMAATSTPRAVLFSALTTIASFGSLALSRHLGLASMGLLLTVAILCSLVCTLVVLPSALALVDRQRRRSAP
jgi:hopanoid biosynthesis associated RND transporter like protein HpnN